MNNQINLTEQIRRRIVRVLPKSWVNLIRQKRWRKTMCGIRQTTTGVRINLRDYEDWLIYHEIFENGEYSEALEELCVRYKKTGSTAFVLDLGGNIGLFALRCADAWLSHGIPLERLKIQSIEPVAENVKVACSLRELNPELAGSWDVLLGVAGLREGRARIIGGPSHYCSSVETDDSCLSEAMNYTDLKLICGAYTQISLMKVDIEGSEVDLLESYSDLLMQTQILSMETHGASRRERCLKLLGAAGFAHIRTTRIVGDGLDEFGSLWSARESICL